MPQRKGAWRTFELCTKQDQKTWRTHSCAEKFYGRNIRKEWIADKTDCAKRRGDFISEKWSDLCKSKKGWNVS